MISREGYPSIVLVTLFALVLSSAAHLFLNHWSAYIIYIASAGLCGLIIYFFRDPDRHTPDDESLVVSPADGKVVLVAEVDEQCYIKGRATQISIFLSPLDVHVNRIPVSGKLEYLEYHPGDYLMAWDHRASELNERADFGVSHISGTKVFFRQITGFLARRIVYHVARGDMVKAGNRFGMMKFGSRMDILLPEEVDVFAREGDTTIAGETVLAKIVID